MANLGSNLGLTNLLEQNMANQNLFRIRDWDRTEVKKVSQMQVMTRNYNPVGKVQGR